MAHAPSPTPTRESKFLSEGRWLNRDRIGERGGENMYRMVDSNPLNLWDLLGQIGSGNGMYLPGITHGPPSREYLNIPDDFDPPLFPEDPPPDTKWDVNLCGMGLKTRFLQVVYNYPTTIFAWGPRSDGVDDGTLGFGNTTNQSIERPFYPVAPDPAHFEDSPMRDNKLRFEVCKVCFCAPLNLIFSIGPCKHWRVSPDKQDLGMRVSVMEPSQEFRDVYNKNKQPGWPALP